MSTETVVVELEAERNRLLGVLQKIQDCIDALGGPVAVAARNTEAAVPVLPPAGRRRCVECRELKGNTAFSKGSDTCRRCSAPSKPAAVAKPVTSGRAGSRRCKNCGEHKESSAFLSGHDVCRKCERTALAAGGVTRTCSNCKRRKPITDFDDDSDTCTDCENEFDSILANV